MTKKVFLDELRDALKENNMSSDIIENNIQYYDSYISDKLCNGVDIEDIMSELGSGRLIAKTIVEADKKGAKSTYYNTASMPEGSKEQRSTYTSNNEKKESLFKFIMNNTETKTKIKAIAIIIAIITALILFAVLTFKVVVFFLPYAITLFIIGVILRFIFSIK